MRTLVFASAVTAAGVACSGGSVGGAPDGADSGQPDPLACESRMGTVSWTLTPNVSRLTGVVTRKVSASGGAEEITIVDAGGAEHRLDLKIGLPAPIATGDQLDIETTEYSAFQIYRTLEVEKDGSSILYVTQLAHASLPPPPLMLEVGDSSCCSSAVPSCNIAVHKLRASDDGGEPVIIDVGRQAQVGRFRVFNDLIMRFPPGTLDAVDTLQVVVVRSP